MKLYLEILKARHRLELVNLNF